MKRYWICAAMGVVGLGLVWVGSRLNEPSAHAVTSQAFQQVQGLERKMSGGWFLYVYESETPAEVLMGLSAGGVEFINATPRPDGDFNCTGIGTWKAAAPNELTSTVIVFNRDLQQNLIFYEKAVSTMTLSDDGSTLEGIGMIYIFMPGQDPMDPEEVPVFQASVPLAAKRIPAE